MMMVVMLMVFLDYNRHNNLGSGLWRWWLHRLGRLFWRRLLYLLYWSWWQLLYRLNFDLNFLMYSMMLVMVMLMVLIIHIWRELKLFLMMPLMISLV